MEEMDMNMDDQCQRAREIEMKKKKNPKVKGKQGQIFDSANYYLEKIKSKKTIEDEEKLKQVTESKESEEISKD
jgi:hypothetical protein